MARSPAAADDGPCPLVTGYRPERDLHSGCDAMTYRRYARLDGPHPGPRVSFVRYEHGRLQPGAAGVERLAGGRSSQTSRIPADGSLGTATVVTVHRHPP
ncbi:hypothetical protein GCM10023083_07610 [Streptomyces phyllanthi]